MTRRGAHQVALAAAFEVPSLLWVRVLGYRVYREDLPPVSVSRLRALGVITADTTEFLV